MTGGSGANAGAKEDKEKTEEGENTCVEGEEAKEEGGKFSYETGLAGLTSAFSTFGKAATDATNVLKDKVSLELSSIKGGFNFASFSKVAEVGTTNMLSEFTKEQESFIKSKNASHSELGIAPWVGYHDEDELKVKILALSEDKRTFVRAPPSGVTFEFEYSSVSSTALALLQEDPRLQKMRWVPIRDRGRFPGFGGKSDAEKLKSLVFPSAFSSLPILSPSKARCGTRGPTTHPSFFELLTQSDYDSFRLFSGTSWSPRR